MCRPRKCIHDPNLVFILPEMPKHLTILNRSSNINHPDNPHPDMDITPTALPTRTLSTRDHDFRIKLETFSSHPTIRKTAICFKKRGYFHSMRFYQSHCFNANWLVYFITNIWSWIRSKGKGLSPTVNNWIPILVYYHCKKSLQNISSLGSPFWHSTKILLQPDGMP